MKRRLLLIALLFGCVILTRAQSVGTPTLITDTVHYYFNKCYFKSGLQHLRNYQYYKGAVATVTDVTHVGSLFENNEPVEVFGLEALAARNKNSGQASVKVHLYLYKAGPNGLPLLPLLDSVVTTVVDTAIKKIGGNFAVSHTLTGNFIVLMRNLSTTAGDTVNFLRTSSKTFTAWPGATWQQKYSDGYGILRFYDQFKHTTNFDFNGFGMGTDYEFCVAPRVRYEITAKEYWPQEVIDGQTICTYKEILFTNASSARISHRMYNLHEFVRKWDQPLAPLMVAPAGGWPADSAITWKFDNEDNPVTGGKKYLPYGGIPASIGFITDSVLNPICSDQNFFRVNFRGMGMYGHSAQINYQEAIRMCVDTCNGYVLGVNAPTGFEGVRIYPNPLVSDWLTVSGLQGVNTLAIYTMQGQLLQSEPCDKERVTLRLNGLSTGHYMLRLTGNGKQARAITFVTQTE